ncbi:MAG: AbrB/MazE/SpoVT family DNA-binding domain-containing protein [Bacteroidetes bacterium]|nr:AbrB/MazE/SpoVT family DNA-binding domain-containing protein [Bacteroidota bacterium]
MRTSIIQIGNSNGVIIPAEMLRKFNLSRKSLVDIDFSGNSIAVKPAPRQGWEEAFKALSKEDLEEKFFPDFFEDEDLSWWTWDEE